MEKLKRPLKSLELATCDKAHQIWSVLERSSQQLYVCAVASSASLHVLYADQTRSVKHQRSRIRTSASSWIVFPKCFTPDCLIQSFLVRWTNRNGWIRKQLVITLLKILEENTKVFYVQRPLWAVYEGDCKMWTFWPDTQSRKTKYLPGRLFTKVLHLKCRQEVHVLLGFLCMFRW